MNGKADLLLQRCLKPSVESVKFVGDFALTHDHGAIHIQLPTSASCDMSGFFCFTGLVSRL